MKRDEKRKNENTDQKKQSMSGSMRTSEKEIDKMFVQEEKKLFNSLKL